MTTRRASRRALIHPLPGNYWEVGDSGGGGGINQGDVFGEQREAAGDGGGSGARGNLVKMVRFELILSFSCRVNWFSIRRS